MKNREPSVYKEENKVIREEGIYTSELNKASLKERKEGVEIVGNKSAYKNEE